MWDPLMLHEIYFHVRTYQIHSNTPKNFSFIKARIISCTQELPLVVPKTTSPSCLVENEGVPIQSFEKVFCFIINPTYMI